MKQLLLVVLLILLLLVVLSSSPFKKETDHYVREGCPALRYHLQPVILDNTYTVTAAPPVHRPMCISISNRLQEEEERKQLTAMLPEACQSMYAVQPE